MARGGGHGGHGGGQRNEPYRGTLLTRNDNHASNRAYNGRFFLLNKLAFYY